MNLRSIKEYLKELISKQLNSTVSSLDLASIGGGSINSTYRVTVNGGVNFFLKLNSSIKYPGLFQKEKDGLEFLGGQNCIRVPRVIFYTTHDADQLLLLEWIESGTRTGNFWNKFGEQLARLHTVGNEYFGFAEDNYMGSLAQVNCLANSWTAFFIDHRLQPQVTLATNKKLLQRNHITQFESIFKKLDTIFNIENPSLLHGDLWSGNYMCNDKSLPVLIDPAVYFGHRSIDLGMTTLFSGFDKSFYDSYHYHFPLPGNYHEQWEICNLYPLLIHLNLFGSSYLYEIEGTLKRFS